MKPGIDGKTFKIKVKSNDMSRYVPSGVYTKEDIGIKMRVLSDPKPYTKEHKSKWLLINWWRKLIGTYYEHGYKYTVKIEE